MESLITAVCLDSLSLGRRREELSEKKEGPDTVPLSLGKGSTP